ncbi:MAG: hypothetical protein A2Z01_03745 [Betaproteobacteria bacterium RBG_16_58_11]|nr:MAG: hypothetical protein A2Z01_03745 [Betaproteobacteria bacterium RBG_16_58_11]
MDEDKTKQAIGKLLRDLDEASKGNDLFSVVIEHLNADSEQAIAVRIERVVAGTEVAEAFVTDDPAFGIWRDREASVDVEACLHKLRMPRYRSDGARNKG